MSTPPPPKSFTIRYPGRVNTLIAETLISKPVPPGLDGAQLNDIATRANKYIGIWDTGATNSVISQRVVDECDLKPTGMAMVQSATEKKLCETFLVSIFLPNKVVEGSVRVTKGAPAGCDILIGMDIISRGDFAVTQLGGKTTFSFRIPSMEEIDFVAEKKEPAHSTKISRNSPCFCGSGKKYKRCHGKNVA